MKLNPITILLISLTLGGVIGAGVGEMTRANPAGEAAIGFSANPSAPAAIVHPSYMSPHASPIAIAGDRVLPITTDRQRKWLR